MNALADLLMKLRRCIDDAEHKPGQWASARSQMGGISSASTRPTGADVAHLLGTLKESSWAGFSYKRDSWLAVEAVNALPALMQLAQAVLTQAEGRDEAGQVARALLAGLDKAPDLESSADEAESAQGGSQTPAASGVDSDASAGGNDAESQGALMIVAERRRQQVEKGWTAAHDDKHKDQSMAMVCALYAAPVPLYEMTGGRRGYHFVDPWPDSWCGAWDRRRVDSKGQLKERSLDEQVEDLTKAGALAAAEIDRLLRAKHRAGDSITGSTPGMSSVVPR